MLTECRTPDFNALVIGKIDITEPHGTTSVHPIKKTTVPVPERVSAINDFGNIYSLFGYSNPNFRWFEREYYPGNSDPFLLESQLPRRLGRPYLVIVRSEYHKDRVFLHNDFFYVPHSHQKIMSHLKSEGFNRSLRRIFREVGSNAPSSTAAKQSQRFP
jgi:hypothetical protein